MGIVNVKEKPSTGIATLSKYEFAKIELEEFLKDYINYVVTPETYKEAVKALSKIKDKRFHVQNVRDQNKKVLNMIKKTQEEQATEFIELIEKIESPIAAAIKEIEDKREEEKNLKAQAEKDRLAKIESDRKAAEEKLIQDEKDRLQKIRLENEQKEKELKEREDKLRQAEQDAIDKKRKEQEEADAKIKADQDNIEAEKKKLEKQKIDLRFNQLALLGFIGGPEYITFQTHTEDINIDHSALIDYSDEEFNKIIDQAKPKVEAHNLEVKRLADEAAAKAKAEKEAADKLKADQEAARLEALKPEKEKLLHYAHHILPWNEIPEVTTPEAKAITANIRIMLEKMQAYINNEVSKLK